MIRSVLYFLVFLACAVITPDNQLPSRTWTPTSVLGFALDLPPLVKESIGALNSLTREIFPETKGLPPLLENSDVLMIVDRHDLVTSMNRLRPGSANEDDAVLQALAAVPTKELPIWLMWQHKDARMLQARFAQGQNQPIYVLAAVLAHELGHVQVPDDCFAAHAVQLAVLEEYEKRGMIQGYEIIINNARMKANQPHRGCR